MNRLARLVGLLAIAAASMLAPTLIAGPATASSPSWHVVPVAPPVPSNYNSLGSTSCVSSGWCMAVGGYDSGPYNQGNPWALQRVGGKWVATSPSAAGANDLWGVSCTSSTFCMAVGPTINGNPGTYLWNGTSWSSIAGPDFNNPRVSCASSTFCMVTGITRTNPTPESALWTGAYYWTMSALPTRAFAISCPTIHFCATVGFGSAVWNNGTWTTVPVPGFKNPASLWGVSCMSSTWCMAAGVRLTSTTNWTLAEEWNGSQWSVVPTPNRSNQSEFNNMTCASPTFCVAVGDYGASTAQPPTDTGTLIEQWNGSSWAKAYNPQPRPPAAGQFETLWSVSCASASACQTVGEVETNSGFNAIAESYA